MKVCLVVYKEPAVMCECLTFSTLHALHEDAAALGQHPVATLVAVLPEHHEAQRTGRLKQFTPDLDLLLRDREREGGREYSLIKSDQKLAQISY